MKIRAKFECMSAKRFATMEEVELVPTTRGDGDNKDWSKWTPSGALSMSITAQGAVGQFEPGRCYWLDFSEVGGAADTVEPCGVSIPSLHAALRGEVPEEHLASLARDMARELLRVCGLPADEEE